MYALTCNHQRLQHYIAGNFHQEKIFTNFATIWLKILFRDFLFCVTIINGDLYGIGDNEYLGLVKCLSSENVQLYGK